MNQTHEPGFDRACDLVVMLGIPVMFFLAFLYGVAEWLGWVPQRK